MSNHELNSGSEVNSGLDAASGLPGSNLNPSRDIFGQPLSKNPTALGSLDHPLLKPENNHRDGADQADPLTGLQTQNSTMGGHGYEFESGIAPIDYTVHLAGKALDAVDQVIESSTPVVKKVVNDAVTQISETVHDSIDTAQKNWNAPDNELRTTLNHRFNQAIGFAKQKIADLSADPDVKEAVNITTRLGRTVAERTKNFIETAQSVTESWVDQAFDSSYLDKSLSTTSASSDSSESPFIGVIDTNFKPQSHGAQVADAIQQSGHRPDWLGDGVGTGHWTDSLVQFVDAAKASGRSGAVVNLSFDLTQINPDGSVSTRSELTGAEKAALTYAQSKGVLIVASAGNQDGAMSALGQASLEFDNIITVGAADGTHRANYSSYGAGLDLLASGSTKGSALTGTSLAAAAVTGTVAKLWAGNPQLSASQVIQSLESTAKDLNTPGWDAETGFGLLNPAAAVNLAEKTVPEPQNSSSSQLIQPGDRTTGQIEPQPNQLLQGESTWNSPEGAIPGERPNWLDLSDWSDIAHGALDVAGFIPGAGAIADIANAGLYAAEGDYANAALSAAAAVPGIGDAAAAVKLADRGVQAMQVANRGADATQDITARAIPSQPPPSRPQNPAAPESTPPSGSRQPELERPPATSERQQPVPERSGSPEAAPRSGVGSFKKGVAATTVLAMGATHVAPLVSQEVPIVSEEVPGPKPSGSNPSPTRPYPGSTPTQSPSEQPNPTPGQVTIQPGDTLWEIAQIQLGSGDRWTDLLQSDGSPFTEQEASRLPVGTIVHLPTPAPLPPSPPQTPAPNTPISPDSTPTQSPSPSPMEQPNSTPGQITMRQGDTLWEIAQIQLGSGDRWTDLLQSDGSPFTEQEARRLPIGTIVHLPPSPAPLPPSLPQAPTPNTPISPSPTPTDPTPAEITYPKPAEIQYPNPTQPSPMPVEIPSPYPSPTPISPSPTLPDPTPVTLPSPSPTPTNPMPVPTPNIPISPSPTLPDPTPATIPSPSPSPTPISPNSTPTHLPWSPPPAEIPDLTPHTHDTRDLKYGVELTNSNQAQMPENTSGTPRDELEASPRSSEGGTEPSQERPADGGDSPSSSNSEPNHPNKPPSIPTSINDSKLLPENATPEQKAVLQKLLDGHPDLDPLSSGIDPETILTLVEDVISDRESQTNNSGFEGDVVFHEGNVPSHINVTDKPPSGQPVPENFDIGNFAHENAELFIDESELPRGLNERGRTKEVTIKLADGGTRRPDRVDWEEGVVYEIKPSSQKELGRKEAERDAHHLDEEHPLPNGRKWRGKVATYDWDEVIRFARKIGWIEDPSNP